MELIQSKVAQGPFHVLLLQMGNLALLLLFFVFFINFSCTSSWEEIREKPQNVSQWKLIWFAGHINEDTMETYYINSVKVNWGLAITSFPHVPKQEEYENKC